MNEVSHLKTSSPSVTIQKVTEKLSKADLNDLSDATDAAIEDGGGFGWIKIPGRDMQERYWQGVVVAPTRWLFVARLEGVICGTTQVVLPPFNNEAQQHMVQLTTHFVAPWARGHGLAKMLIEKVEGDCLETGYAVINLDVREKMEKAIALYESMGYVQFGLHPYSVCAEGQAFKSRYYYKVINPDFFK